MQRTNCLDNPCSLCARGGITQATKGDKEQSWFLVGILAVVYEPELDPCVQRGP
jgi:hypothetical protein